MTAFGFALAFFFVVYWADEVRRKIHDIVLDGIELALRRRK
jgi:hypothetical protein